MKNLVFAITCVLLFLTGCTPYPYTQATLCRDTVITTISVSGMALNQKHELCKDTIIPDKEAPR